LSAKLYCLIPHNWTLATLNLHTCSDNSHAHLSRQQASDYTSVNLVETLREPLRRTKLKGVLRMMRMIPVRGLSARVGEPLALALADKCQRDWASTMLGNIQCRRETASTPGVGAPPYPATPSAMSI